MITRSLLPLMALSTLLLAAAGCTGPGYRDPEDSERMRSEIGDRNIATRVRIALSEDPETAPYEEIGVFCQSGVVTLSGEVDRPEVKQRAVRIARGCQGVKKVIDRISVRTPPS